MDRTRKNDFILTDYAQRVIKYKSRQLRQRQDFQSVEPEDLQQDLWLALVKAAEHFDPAKASLDTFIDRVVNTAAAMLVRARRRHKHGNGFRVESLDSQRAADGEKSEPLLAAVSGGDLTRRTGSEPRDETARREDAEAVEDALARMSDEMRDLCRRLMGGTVTSVARDLGVSRRLVRKVVAEAMPFLERAGLNPK